ncbi:MAG TPA: DUF3754 domain-containing protein [Gemmataceae bacterium]|nr:DUF3754 domain-containing protein [Gemmataceae bacterium]
MEASTVPEHFIPLARCELVDFLCADLALAEGEADGFRLVCEQVAALYHLEYHRRLNELKQAYLPFDPDNDTTRLLPLTAAERQTRLNELLSDLAWLLERAGFKHLSRSEIEPALEAASDWGIHMNVDFSVFEYMAIFARGDTIQRRRRRRWYTLYRTEEAEVPIYRRLVLILKLRRHPRLRELSITDDVYLKIFKDIPKLDVVMLLPGARVHLSRLDRGKIGLPLLSGLALAAWNVLQDLAVLLERWAASPNTLWALAVGGIGYGYKSIHGYQQTKQRYHLTLTQSLYFQNLDSNAGVLTRLLDEAEEQESRLAILAYWCLWRYAGPDGWTAADLDASVELYLDRYADLPLFCRSNAALTQLQKLRLVEATGERFHAVTPPRAIEILKAGWNQFFTRRIAANVNGDQKNS